MPRLLGRKTEQQRLDRLIEGARGGTGAALVLIGEPGIGKTVLLDYAVARATGFRVLSCRGVPSETEVAFAALHELLWPVLDLVDGLPAAQADALRGALGLAEPQGGPLLIGVAVLTLLSELAERQPVLVVVDDLHLLDAASRNSLAFVARRTAADPILVLFAAHPGTAGPAQTLPVLTVPELDPASAQQLAAQQNPSLSPLRMRRLLRLTAGNPLALVELSRGAGRELGPAADRRPELGPRLRDAFEVAFRQLGAGRFTALLVAAAEDGGDTAVVLRAAHARGASDADWHAALESGLMRAEEGRITVRHPLIRAAVLETADPAERRAVHATLAQVLAETDPDRSAWHLAEAATHPDESIAAALDAVAERAWARGGLITAARTLRRAAALSPDAASAALRLSRSARAAWDSGDVETARELLTAAGDRADPEEVSIAGGGLAGMFELGQGNPERARELLSRDAARVEPRFRAELRHGVTRAEWVVGDAMSMEQLATLAAEGVEVPAVGGGRAADRVYPEGRAAVGADARDGDTRGGAVIGRDARGEDAGDPLLPWRLPVADIAMLLGTETQALALYHAGIDRLRTEGPISWLGYTLGQRSWLYFVTGRWDDALTDTAEALRLAVDFTGRKTVADAYRTMAFIAALRGDAAAVDEFNGRVLEFAEPRGYYPLTSAAYWCRALHALGDGRTDDAGELLDLIAQPGHPAHHPSVALLSAGYAIEAAVRSGRPERAERYLKTLVEYGESFGPGPLSGAVPDGPIGTGRTRTNARSGRTPADTTVGRSTRRDPASAEGVVARSAETGTVRGGVPDWVRADVELGRALLAAGADAEAHFTAALESAPAHRPFALARYRLAYGEWLRRARRRLDAQEQLRGALRVFEGFGAGPWAARAARELTMAGDRQAGTGETPQRTLLTAQELQVAKLAATGLTNRDIAARLLISPRTVGHHLSNVFQKLGLARREQLASIDFERGFRLSL
ncbi:AAA family ATPase [Nocardia sp. 2]|uniref:AAA family ATPase n=1 Tax=Nocardia acididurans TaxID=2802282 RepID=A0ABS1MJL2_9NOCA|nr:LuxR family transcriptional regulator [Nocardia acididurans]MBL1079433.1 AAA family ATPase [Nocardia acididurans]